MKAFRIVLLNTLVVAVLGAIWPAPSSAADYWGGYWNWYDGSYVPSYQRYYSAAPVYSAPAYSSYYGAPAYSSYGPVYSGYSPAYSGYGYGYAPYGGTYYGAPAAGVGVYPGTAAVRVGPLGIGWR